MNRLLLSLALLGTVLFAGCSTPAPTAGLRLELASIERQADGRATATVRIVNPNLVAYNIASAQHRISLDGRSIGTLQIDKALGLPAQNVGVHTGDLKLEAGAALAPGTASYRMDSRVVITLYGERTETSRLQAAGSVTVK